MIYVTPITIQRVYAELLRVEKEREPYPTVRQLAERLGLSTSTVHHACHYLAERHAAAHHCGWGLPREPRISDKPDLSPDPRADARPTLGGVDQ